MSRGGGRLGAYGAHGGVLWRAGVSSVRSRAPAGVAGFLGGWLGRCGAAGLGSRSPAAPRHITAEISSLGSGIAARVITSPPVDRGAGPRTGGQSDRLHIQPGASQPGPIAHRWRATRRGRRSAASASKASAALRNSTRAARMARFSLLGGAAALENGAGAVECQDNSRIARSRGGQDARVRFP